MNVDLGTDKAGRPQEAISFRGVDAQKGKLYLQHLVLYMCAMEIQIIWDMMRTTLVPFKA